MTILRSFTPLFPIGSAGVGEVKQIDPRASHSFMMQVGFTDSTTQAVLEGSVDGTVFSPLTPLGEADGVLVFDGFYTYHRLPPFIRVVVTGTGQAEVGGVFAV